MLLAKQRKAENLPIITNLSDAPKDAPQFGLSERISTVIGLSNRLISGGDWQYRKHPYFLSDGNEILLHSSENNS